MDPRHFDAITKRLATDSSRRQVIKGLLGGAAAGLLALSRSGSGTAAGSMIAWPFKPGDGGQWGIASGYGQGDHTTNGSRYSLDFARCTGTIDPTTNLCSKFDLSQTHGATVYAPVSGTIAWGDDDCVTLAINIDGDPNHRIELAHIDKSPSLPGGTSWEALAGWRDKKGKAYHFNQGDPIGTVSSGFCCFFPGCTGNHIHTQLYQYAGPDGSDSDRTSVPFVDQWAISGCPYPIDTSHEGELAPCCPPGQQRCASGKCITACRGGYVIDTAACKCVCPTRGCPSGSTLDQNTCQCVGIAPTVTAGPIATALTATGATITWTTDQLSDSTVSLGTSKNALFQTVIKSDPATSHSVPITGLRPATTYYFQAASTNAAGTATSKIGSFTTHSCAQDGLTNCNGACIDLANDLQNCGACGYTCLNVSFNMVCVNGACLCKQGLAFCSDPGTGGGVCVDPATDPNHCGGCGNVCPVPANGTATCAAGNCGIACNAGYTNCNGSCVDLNSDPNNCGACGGACESGQKCYGGSCYNFCAATSFCCESASGEILACGGNNAGSYCAPPSVCISCPGRCCADGCMPDGSTIGTGSRTGCCLPGDDACLESVCPNNNCPSGKTLCGEACFDLQFSLANCGSCGTTCGAGETCVNGQCAQA